MNIPSLKRTNSLETERFPVPKTVQQLLPIQAVHEDGIFELPGYGKLIRYSMTFVLWDIDYFVVSDEHRQRIAEWYEAYIKSLDAEAVTKITVANMYMNRVAYERKHCHPLTGDGLDMYRGELNALTMSAISEDGHPMQMKYVTTTVPKRNIAEARAFFARVHADTAAHMEAEGIKSGITVLTGNERLRILHDWFRKGEELFFDFNLTDSRKRGHTFADYVLPEAIERNLDHLVIDGKYVRSLYIRDFPSYLRDSLIRELTSLPQPLFLSYDIVPCDKAEAERAVSRVVDGVNADGAKYTQRQFTKNTMAPLPPQLEQKLADFTALYDELHKNDQRMIFVTLTLTHMADTLEQLNEDTETLLATARKRSCQMAKLYLRQEDGMFSTLPIGVRKIQQDRSMLSEPASMLIPFATCDRQDEDGMFSGMNKISQNPIFINRAAQQNGNCIIFGVPGSGKSVLAKKDIAEHRLYSPDDQIIIVDPEREYAALVNALGGNVIDISVSGNNHLNALDTIQGIEDDSDPVPLKTQYVLTLFEMAISGTFTPAERSVLDRITSRILRAALNDPAQEPPTLLTLYNALMTDERPEAQSVATAVEIYVTGSMNIFAKPSNVSLDNRLLCFDIHQLGGALKPMGMFVILDFIMNMIKKNRQNGIRTWVYFDEWYLMFQSPANRALLHEYWKRARKYDAKFTGITQNVSDVLKDDETETLLSNSEYLYIMNQGAKDRDTLAAQLDLSPGQMSFITNAKAGHGLIRAGESIIPFELAFPTNTELYKLITTKPGEAIRVSGK